MDSGKKTCSWTFSHKTYLNVLRIACAMGIVPVRPCHSRTHVQNCDKPSSALYLPVSLSTSATLTLKLLKRMITRIGSSGSLCSARTWSNWKSNVIAERKSFPSSCPCISFGVSALSRLPITLCCLRICHNVPRCETSTFTFKATKTSPQ